MRRIFWAVMSVALLAACSNRSSESLPEPEITFEKIEGCAEEDVEVMDDYLYYFFEADSLLQREVEINLQDSTRKVEYAVLPFQVDPRNRIHVMNAVDEMIFNLGKDSVEAMILFHNKDFLDSLENRLQGVEFRVFTLNTIVNWDNEEF